MKSTTLQKLQQVYDVTFLSKDVKDWGATVEELEQLERVVSSMISTNVEKSKVKKGLLMNVHHLMKW